MNSKIKTKKEIALSELIILVLSLFAFSFIVGESIPSVLADDSPIIRTIPGGEAEDPRDNQQIISLMQLSDEELAQYFVVTEEKLEGASNVLKGSQLGIIGLVKTGGMTLGAGATLLRLFSKKAFQSVTTFAGNFADKIFRTGFNQIGSARYTAIGSEAATPGSISSSSIIFSGIVSSIVASVIASQVVLVIFQLFGASQRNLSMGETAAWIGAGGGALAGTLITVFTAEASVPGVGWMAAAFTIVIMGVVMLFNYKKYSQDVFRYQVGLWQPASGGELCEQCHNLKYGCSEYQCHSYGAACTLINKNTEESRCIWMNSTDITPPRISVNLDSLPNEKYSFVEHMDESGPVGATILYNGGNLPAFQGLNFGITTDKPAQCAYDIEYEYGEKLIDMVFGTNLGSTSFVENHSVYLSNVNFPSEYSLQEIDSTIEPDTPYTFYFICKSFNGHETARPFLITFKLEDGPDLTAPEIIEATPINNSYVKAGKTSQEIEIRTNEPAICRWSFVDKEYSEMENEMLNCSKDISDYKFNGLNPYGCITTLNGIKDTQTNYYIRCMDKPSLNTSNEEIILKYGNQIVNQESYVYSLSGTKELAISKILVNDEFAYESDKGSTVLNFEDSTSPLVFPVIVSTVGGAKSGESRCYYKNLESSLEFEFYNEGKYQFLNPNIDKFVFNNGINAFSIRCCDVAQNCDSEIITVITKIDLDAPEISRVYSQGNQLKIITNEKSECAYSTSSCNYLFEDGTAFYTYDGIEHSTNWETEIDLFVKCKDKYGNLPNPVECQMILRPSK